MKQWTLGFVFTPDFSQVLLIHKEHTGDQKGFWNGLGGKFEKDETGVECIAREVKEESDLTVSDWRMLGKLHGHDWEMDILTAIYNGKMVTAKTMTDEEVRWWSVGEIKRKDVKRNLQWLIPLCIDALKYDEIEKIDILYTHSSHWQK